MSDIQLTWVLPGGASRVSAVPDDVPMNVLIPLVIRLLELPSQSSNGHPMDYRPDSTALGRPIAGGETLGSAGVPQHDRIALTADITAGAGLSDVAQSPRMRRLRSDQDLMQELAGRTNLISFVAQSPRPNLPAERYIITFKCRSIANVDRQGHPVFSEHHQVEIYLHNQYPQRWPGMKWLTPIWHPNINHLNGSVCIDAAWWTASRSLDRLVIMLGEMLQYKNFHDDPTRPPFPWDPEAARWSREYRKKHPNVFPVDSRELMRPERVKLNEAAGSMARTRSRVRLMPAGAAPGQPGAGRSTARPSRAHVGPVGSALAPAVKLGAARPGRIRKSASRIVKRKLKVRIK
jgi:ubiquitin-protein ligase